MHSRAHSPGLRSRTRGLSSIGSLDKAHSGICPEKLAPVTPISLRTFARLVFRLFFLTVLSLITLGLSPKIALPGGSSPYRRLTGRFGSRSIRVFGARRRRPHRRAMLYS